VKRLVLAYMAKAAAIAAPVLAPHFVSIPWIRGDEKLTGVYLSLFLLAVIFLFDAFERGLPALDAAKFRDEYVERFVKKYFKLGKRHLRFNVMVARRRWYFLWLTGAFEWTASRGFDPGVHHDAKMWLGTWQGVAGEALREEKTSFVDLRTTPEMARHPVRIWKNPFGLTLRQLRKTRHVLAILSVPMVVKRGMGGNPSLTATGVINVDAVSAQGAEWLSRNWERLGRSLEEAGTLLGSIR
jgi:hypothetical protein